MKMPSTCEPDVLPDGSTSQSNHINNCGNINETTSPSASSSNPSTPSSTPTTSRQSSSVSCPYNVIESAAKSVMNSNSNVKCSEEHDIDVSIAVNGKNGHDSSVNGYSNGYIEEDIDDSCVYSKTNGDVSPNKHSNATVNQVNNGATTSTNANAIDKNSKNHSSVKSEEKQEEDESESKQDQEFIFIHDTGFNVHIQANGLESFEIQVSSMELVQEIHHLLMDREDTCHRTCFSLQLDGLTLDNFAELKNIEGLKEGSLIKVVEEPYTVREARIHVRHVRDLLKSLDPADAYNGVDCNSLSFVNVIAQEDTLDKKKGLRQDSIDCTPPDNILPQCKERPLAPLQPFSKEQKVMSNGPQAMKVLTTSGWNPPPGNRKLHGDLMYLYVVTLEDKRFHITSSTRGFFVNQSSEEEFNPKPATPKLVFHSLIDLLSQISPTFKRNFVMIQRKRHQRHPFERVATPYQVYTWTAPHLDHTIDSIRAEDAFSSKLGYEEHIPGQTRDWNEELQTTRELKRKTLPERLLRERAIFKVHSDFIAAASRGAMAVIDGNVMAINPGEETKMQMFIWNNIFFSLGFDVRDHYKELGGDAAAFAAPCNDLQGVKAYSAIDIEGLYTLGTAVIDYKGYRVTAQSIIPGILEREQEQSVVYGSVDFGKSVVTHSKYLELLNKAGQVLKILPHKVINEKGEEVELCSSVECKGIIGNDGRHYILDLLRTFPPDVNFLILDGEELSRDMKALAFPKQHKHKLCCLRQELVDAFFESRYMMFIKLAAYHLQQLGLKNLREQELQKQGHKQITNQENEETKEQDKTNLNEEKKAKKKNKNKNKENGVDAEEEINSNLKKASDEAAEDYKKIVESFTSGEKSEFDSTKEIIRKAAQAVGSLKDNEFDIRFNPDVFSPGVKHADSDGELIAKQKQLIKDSAAFLMTVQVPAFIRDSLEHTSTPFDGFTLSEALHTRGINIRYLGKIADLLSKYNQLEYLHSIAVSELICRSIKHIFTSYIQGIETMSLAHAMSHFLNCFLSSCVSSSSPTTNEELASRQPRRKGKKKNRQNILNVKDNNEWTNLTPKSLFNNLKNELDSYYGWKLNVDSIESAIETFNLQKISLLRSFCIKTGVQLLLREYHFDHKTRPTFTEDDILNVFPVVKHIAPRASDAYNFYSTGQRKIQEGFLKEGYELISEALNLLNNVYGAMHPEIAQCLRMLARLNYIMGDHLEAMAFQQKAVLMSEKVNGIDHAYTITEYTHLALYCFANSQVSTALKFLYRARYLLLLICGENHPEMAILDSNIGLILHAVGEYDLSLRFLENALKLNTKYFGNRSLKVAVSYHLVARTQSCMGDFRGALQNEKETYSIYKQQLGEEHEKTKESSECLRHLTQQAVVLQKKMNEIYKGNSTAMIPPIQIQPPSISSVLDMLNIINGILFVHLSSQEIETLKSSDNNGDITGKKTDINCESLEDAKNNPSQDKEATIIENDGDEKINATNVSSDEKAINQVNSCENEVNAI